MPSPCPWKILSLNRPESWMTNPPGHLCRDKWTALSGPLSVRLLDRFARVLWPPTASKPALEATRGQMDGFFSQLPYKCHLAEVEWNLWEIDSRFALNLTPGWPRQSPGRGRLNSIVHARQQSSKVKSALGSAGKETNLPPPAVWRGCRKLSMLVRTRNFRRWLIIFMASRCETRFVACGSMVPRSPTCHGRKLTFRGHFGCKRYVKYMGSLCSFQRGD